MGDTLSPGDAGPETGPAPRPPAPAPQPPGAYPPSGVYPPPPGAYPPPGALAIVEPPRRDLAPPSPPADHSDRYAPDIKPPSPVWQAIKWPLRKTLLAIYIVTQAARRHKAVALVVSALLIGLIATALVVRQLTLPGPPPLAIEQSNRLPPLPASVIHFLHGQETFNAQEVWDSLDTTARSQSGGESQLQSTFNQERAQGFQTTRLVYSGGYQSPDGTSHYTIEVYVARSGQTATFTLFITVGANGLITAVGSL